MMWVDQPSYFGPDRRRRAASLRIRERRRENLAGHPPALNVALRQLRMQIIEARGPGLDRFIERAHSTSILAQENCEHDAADALSALSVYAARNRELDVRPALYQGLDRAHAALNTYH
ncbi:hypothetical protein [Vitreimonas flagellata]|uniref:hypothetical protein n=1 Tax=Vitreimonas flagellata TaxID=2560861 RepID=UPI001074B393|nr:hypothetical protein [Vitreimonas flagellata]